MSTGPGRVQRAILKALARFPDLDYGDVTRLLFGEGFTVGDRANVGRAIRSLEQHGQVKIFYWGASVACVRLGSDMSRTPQFPTYRAVSEAAQRPLLRAKSRPRESARSVASAGQDHRTRGGT
jgi:hypothetical protein